MQVCTWRPAPEAMIVTLTAGRSSESRALMSFSTAAGKTFLTGAEFNSASFCLREENCFGSASASFVRISIWVLTGMLLEGRGGHKAKPFKRGTELHRKHRLGNVTTNPFCESGAMGQPRENG